MTDDYLALLSTEDFPEPAPRNTADKADRLKKAAELGVVISLAIDAAPPGTEVDIRAIMRTAPTEDAHDDQG
ncbi:hypothetical protein [Gordonia amicalis]|uniref:hypothetical protein n=1 Tax=Gordonia amicalis TaxID=89053 RepID=UPI0024B90916|nr:hypothetical protein [Gordonia amicalis]MDJ0454081.1 hypothetical protein [Gordonia amicalis]MDV7077225.1 hypothetical protein [Gordonia amicalis]